MLSLWRIDHAWPVSNDLNGVTSTKYAGVNDELDPLYLTRLTMESEFVGSYKCSLREPDKAISKMSLKHHDKTAYIIVRGERC